MGITNIMECQCCGNRDAKSFRRHERGYICGCCGVAFYLDDDTTVSNDEKNRIAGGYANLRNYEFSKARYAFMDVLTDYPKSIDARWGLLLAKYGVVFIKGFFDGVVEPIYCFPEYDELSNKMFRGEKEYGEILELIENDEDLVDFYEKKSRKIDTAIRKFRECKDDIERDVFLCVKISAATERDPGAQGRTEDYEYAKKIYNDLRAKGMNVFFSFVTLHNEVQSDHEIWLNLVKSKKMLLIGSKEEYIESAWVKSEWKRWFFLNRHDDMYICSMRHDYQNPKSILPHELRTTQIYTLDTYDKLISDISGETAAAEERARLEAEERAKKAEELRRKAEIEDRIRWEEEMKAQFQAQLKAQAEAMEKMKAEMEAKAKAEAEAKAKAEAEAKTKAEADAKAKAEAEAKAKAEAEAKAKAEAEAKTKAEAEAKAKAEAEAKAKAEAEAKAKAEAEAKAKAEAEAKAKAETEAKDKAEAEAKAKAKAKAEASVQTATNQDGKIVYKDGRYKGGIKEVAWHNGPVAVSERSFYSDDKILSVVLPNSITKINASAFAYCINLTEIIISDNVTEIEQYAFEHCYQLTKVTISAGVTKIGIGTFNQCLKLKDVYYGGTQEQWAAITICADNRILKSATVHFSESATAHFVDGTKAKDSKELYELGKKYYWGRGVAQDYVKAVEYYTKAAELGNVDAQYKLGFCYENGYGVSKDNEKAIEWYKKAAEQGNNYAEKAFERLSPDGKIVYTDGSTKILKYGMTSVGVAAYMEKTNIAKVVLPESVTNIQQNAFDHCASLKSIKIPEGVEFIGKSAFHLCSSLESINIPSRLKEIESYAFSACSKLTDITIPGNVTRIGDSAFMSCRGIKEIKIPSSVKEIGVSAFNFCTGLTSVTIPNGVPSIKIRTFSDCVNLKSVTIPKSVTSIGDSAFENCDALTDIYYSGSKSDWAKIQIGRKNTKLTALFGKAIIHFNSI